MKIQIENEVKKVSFGTIVNGSWYIGINGEPIKEWLNGFVGYQIRKFGTLESAVRFAVSRSYIPKIDIKKLKRGMTIEIG